MKPYLSDTDDCVYYFDESHTVSDMVETINSLMSKTEEYDTKSFGKCRVIRICKNVGSYCQTLWHLAMNDSVYCLFNISSYFGFIYEKFMFSDLQQVVDFIRNNWRVQIEKV